MLAYLEQELVAGHYDLKHVYRLILNSKTYQLSCHARSRHVREATANFACYPLRRLEAEVLIDALCQITGTTEKYSSAIPEPFTFIPEDQRSIALPDGSITSPFLEMFGRPPRDTGLESERNNRPTAAQRLHLLNSTPHPTEAASKAADLQDWPSRRRARARSATELYLTILSRFPTPDELKIVEAYSKSGVARQGGSGGTWPGLCSTARSSCIGIECSRLARWVLKEIRCSIHAAVNLSAVKNLRRISGPDPSLRLRMPGI